MLYGCSSGGFAIPIILDAIAEMIHEVNPYTEVLGVADAGFYINFDDHYITERPF